MSNQANKRLRKHWSQVFRGQAATDGIALVHRLSMFMDGYFQERLDECSVHPDTFSILAVGGYGRKELCLGSDIDVLLLVSDSQSAPVDTFARALFTPLWDQGFALGHNVMTILQTMKLARKEYTFLVSLLDGRLAAGSKHLALSLFRQLDTLLAPQCREQLASRLMHDYRARHDRERTTKGMLEPDLKEGVGGLRDAHLVHWISLLEHKAYGLENLTMHGLLSPEEQETLSNSLRHLLVVRNCLHGVNSQKGDRLFFDVQQRVAGLLGYEDKNGQRGVEYFLADLHRHMREIRILCECFVTRFVPRPLHEKSQEKYHAGRSVINLKESDLDEDPGVMMDAFVRSGLTGCPLSWATRKAITSRLDRVTGEDLADERFTTAIESILVSDRAYETLLQMLETGYLGVLIPEFGIIQDRVQFDAYHLFPVGVHTLETIRAISQCTDSDSENFVPFLCRFSRDRMLRWAALLHDIGKTGPNHAQRSGTLADKILQRMGWPPSEREQVVFLVSNHLLLIHTALRRDLDDESVIHNLAFTLRTVTRLHRLTLLTWADSRATGPKAWSSWTRTLLKELVLKTVRMFNQDTMAVPLAVQRIAQSRDFLRSRTNDLFTGPELEPLLTSMPPRYFLHHEKEDILRHLEGVKALLTANASTTRHHIILRESPNHDHPFTRDRPGLFASIAGTLALNDIQVFTASLHRWDNGIIVDSFLVTPPPDPLYQEATWSRIDATLSKTFTEPEELARLLAEKNHFASRPYHPHCLEKACVRIDNGGSDFHSIIELRSKDKPGLLYAIARGLQQTGLDVAFAKIATHKDQVQDIFYVQDAGGQKIVDDDEMAALRESLMQSLE
ncbi:[protein-PII] uridylyltransferase [Desulfoplanes sp. PS50]